MVVPLVELGALLRGFAVVEGSPFAVAAAVSSDAVMAMGKEIRMCSPALTPECIFFVVIEFPRKNKLL